MGRDYFSWYPAAMAMSDCDDCLGTPCSCGRGYERPRMSLARLRQVVAVASRVLADREATGDPEPVLHPRQQLTAEQWRVSIDIPHAIIGPCNWRYHPAQAKYKRRLP